MKKEASVMENTLVALIGIVLTTAILVVVIGAFASISDKWSMKQVARQTMLKMETEGYLTSEARGELLSQLENYGLENIDLTGTTESEVGYGKKVVLSIKGTYQNKSLDFAGGISRVITRPSEVNIYYESTAKQ